MGVNFVHQRSTMASSESERKEQEKALSPAIHLIVVDKRTPFEAEFISRRRHRCLKCCGCSAALLLILAVAIIILMLTVFHVKDPTLKLNSLKIDGLDLLSNKTNFMQGQGGGLNLTLLADISIKNPNAASFEFDEATTAVYYDGTVVGEVSSPAGEAGARRTREMSVLIDVMVDRMVGVSRFESDFVAQNFPISTSTRVKGVVNIADFIKKSVAVRINCIMNVNLGSKGVQDRDCKRDVAF